MADVLNDKFDCCGIFDTHAHYFDRRFNEIKGGADGVLQRNVFDSGIEGVINVGTNNVTNRICIEQSKKYEKMYAAVGIHPEDAAYLKYSLKEELKALRETVDTEEKRIRDKIVAIGEIGLDYHYEGFDKDMQAYLFEKQLELAVNLNLPAIIHDRDAHGDCFETVLKYPLARGVFHSYSGSAEMASDLIRRGWMISFSGVVTFKNAERVRAVAASVPLDKMLIETDAPYLAPHPHRGECNHSGLLEFTAAVIADVHGVSPEEVAKITAENAARFFGI